MALRFTWESHTLIYHKPATTSRGALHDRKLWLISVHNTSNPSIKGVGECGIIPKLSPEDIGNFESDYQEVISQLNTNGKADAFFLNLYPALKFAIETALLDLNTGGKKLLFDNPYSRKKEGIKINGLVWMSSIAEMEQEALQKLQSGFDCLKFKIGAQDFDSECRMLESIRKWASDSQLQIRLDANGAFSVDEALYKLKELNRFKIHSIEQPIAINQWDAMQELCAKSPIDIALDEELISKTNEESRKLLKHIQPQFIILKPSLLGGLKASEMWIGEAEKLQIGWWATSALESNIGLNAIAQWLASKSPTLHQGLGTGKLYTQNFEPYTEIQNGYLWMR